MQVNVDENGNAEHVKLIRDLPGFTHLTLQAVKQWGFQPAMLDGQPVKSNVAIAFVFARPNLN